ncbi:AMP-binding protein [Falsiroseomonas sp. HW251]|uniref:AMP-binding protein n=1 Tax=Falsiroseomonas sp. HW251 TaxID=3390998 RepID=UPI003D320170
MHAAEGRAHQRRIGPGSRSLRRCSQPCRKGATTGSGTSNAGVSTIAGLAVRAELSCLETRVTLVNCEQPREFARRNCRSPAVTYRHLELYYAIPGMGAVCHTMNPRLAPDDIGYSLNRAEDQAAFVDLSFVSLMDKLAPRLPKLRRVVFLCTEADLPSSIAGVSLYAYEKLLAEAKEEPDWPVFDEDTASALSYTSGTTGRPKGVLYGHRAQLLHAMAVNSADAIALRSSDRALSCAAMFHAAGWGVPHSAPMAGTSLILPGRHLDPASLVRLIDEEAPSYACGVPAIWLGVLQELRERGVRSRTLKRIGSGGSAVPHALIEGFAALGVCVQHAWGMTETSPPVFDRASDSAEHASVSRLCYDIYAISKAQ